MKGPGMALSTKGEATRERILATALDLFRTEGYESATMRRIAREAGVSVGNAYYYFPSKDHLVHAFYRRSHEEHLTAIEGPLSAEDSLSGRLKLLARTKLDAIDDHHRFAGQLFGRAADPTSPLNPWSEESAPVREEAIELCARVIDGSSTSPPDDLRDELPLLIWTWLMGILLFWIHDRSPGRRRSRRVADRTADIVAGLVSLASHPLMRPLRRRAIALLHELREDEP